MKVLLTGLTGFIGSHVFIALSHEPSIDIVTITRRSAHINQAGQHFAIGDIANHSDWGTALVGCDAIIHLAARVHVMRETSSNPLEDFRRVNRDATINLARQAVQANVKRFIYLSSVGVCGDSTQPGNPFRHDSRAHPYDPYTISKMEAEDALRDLSTRTKMEIVIIRPTLVYGPKAPGNFGALIRALQHRKLLPLGAIGNSRSFIALDNLVDLIMTCLTHPAAANQTFLASDGEDLSTTALLRRTASAMGVEARLFPVPSWLLRLGLTAIGKRGAAQRLLGSLQVDIRHTRETLNWTPPISVDEGLRRAVRETPL